MLAGVLWSLQVEMVAGETRFARFCKHDSRKSRKGLNEKNCSFCEKLATYVYETSNHVM